jgi:hypothetical protein
LYDCHTTDYRITTCKEQYGDDNVYIRERITRGCILRGDVVKLGTNQGIYLTIEEIDKTTYDNSPNQTDTDVTRIMKSEIHTSPTIEKRPQDEEHAQELASHQPTEEYGNRHGIGSMGRKETIVHPSNIVDDMNGILDDGIIARSGTCNPRLT